MRTIGLLGALGLCAPALQGDEVVLKSGRRIVGVVVEETPTTVVLDIGAGQVGFPRSGVVQVVRGPSALAAYRQRASVLRADDADGWLALALWARDQGLQTAATEAFDHVILVAPDNATARRALGHERIDGAWLVGDDAQRARGLVPFEGQWMTLAEQAARLAEREADRRHQREGAEAETRRAEAEARAREAEARARQAEEEARTGGTPVGVYVPWIRGGSRCSRGDCADLRPPRPLPTPEPQASPPQRSPRRPARTPPPRPVPPTVVARPICGPTTSCNTP